jgi:hypothetical protein
MHQDKVLVIGNGESRKDINLQEFIGRITTVGCNAVHRDTIVNHLVCVDNRMIRESIKNVNTCETLIYVRDQWFHTYKKILKLKNIRRVPEIPYFSDKRQDTPKNWGSGTYAVLVASQLDYKKIYLLGYDLYGKGKLINNIYKNTDNYAVSNSYSIDPSYWIHQISKVFELNQEKEFIVINQEFWEMPKKWKFPNVSFLNIKNFKEDLLKD